MGDMADYYMEREMVVDWAIDYHFQPYRDRVCNYCKQGDLHWQSYRGKWRLFNDSKELHTCLGGRKQSAHKIRRQPMGLFNRKPIYISDRGDQFTVEEMEASHLMNAISHHRKQIDVLDWILDSTEADQTNIHLRRISLHTTVQALVKELRTRDPDEDHDLD